MYARQVRRQDTAAGQDNVRKASWLFGQAGLVGVTYCGFRPCTLRSVDGRNKRSEWPFARGDWWREVVEVLVVHPYRQPGFGDIQEVVLEKTLSDFTWLHQRLKGGSGTELQAAVAECRYCIDHMRMAGIPPR
jgi:hypothetical protein